MRVSSPCMASAYDASSAIRFLSADSIRYFISGGTCNGNNDFIGKAHDSSVFDPTLVNTEFIGTGSFLYSDLAPFYLNGSFSYDPADLQCSVGIKRKGVFESAVDFYSDFRPCRYHAFH